MTPFDSNNIRSFGVTSWLILVPHDLSHQVISIMHRSSFPNAYRKLINVYSRIYYNIDTDLRLIPVPHLQVNTEHLQHDLLSTAGSYNKRVYCLQGRV